MRFKIQLTSQAIRDLNDIYLWTKNHWSADQAKKYRKYLKDAISTLKINPERCPIAGDLAVDDATVRKLLAGTGKYKYRIYFCIVRRTVYVLHVCHTSRN